jgi:hypothetical protein
MANAMRVKVVLRREERDMGINSWPENLWNSDVHALRLPNCSGGEAECVEWRIKRGDISSTGV